MILRQAINQDWPVPVVVRDAIMDEMTAGLEADRAQRPISTARVFIAMEAANLRSLKANE